uniref:NlpC/P60 domain-containing protein n=1 Tax=Canis lupus dingo TaxID=286419 RepID=A0A8C0KU89_CANLU
MCKVNALTGAVSTIKFFLPEAFLGRHFETVELEGSEPEPGDLFLFRLLSPTGRWCGAHVGVYCGHGEIIHFEGEHLRLGHHTACGRQWMRTRPHITPRAATACTLRCVCWAPCPSRTPCK